MKLRLKILGAMALVLAVSVGVSFLVLIRYQRSQLLRNTAEASYHLANTIRATLEHAMLANDPTEIQRIVRTVGDQPGIKGVFVLDRAGAVKVAADQAIVGRTLRDGPSGLLIERPRGETAALRATVVIREPSAPFLRSTSLIPNSSQCQGCHSSSLPILGALVVDQSLVEVEQQLRHSLAYMLGSAGLAFLLLTATTYAVLRRLIVTPLADLGRAAQAIQSGEYDTPLTLDRRDEVGELARTLDRMRRRILEHLDEVRRWGQELEVRVAERTEELRTLNRVALVTNEALDLTTMFARALEAGLDALGVAAGAIILVAQEVEGPLVVQEGLAQSEAEALTEAARRTGVEGACAGSQSDAGCLPGEAQAGSRKFACFPIRAKGMLLGVLCADNSGKTSLGPEKLRVLEALAAQLGGTIERAVLHRNLERSFRDLQTSQAAILERERQIAALEAVRAATVTLSHHINNAAAGIAGCREVLATTLGEQADWQVQYALDGIQASVKKIAAVLQALRDLTRISLVGVPGGVTALDVDREIQAKLAQLDADGGYRGASPQAV